MTDRSQKTRIFASILARAETAGTGRQMRDLIDELVEHGDADSLAALRETLDLLQNDAAPTAPPEWIERAVIRVRELSLSQSGRRFADTNGRVHAAIDRVGSAAQRGLHEVMALLVLDSFEGAALPGIRGATRLQPRQLMYESPIGTVHLQIESDGNQLDVLGQFLPADGSPSGATALLETSSGSTTVLLTDTGEFSFSSASMDRFEIRIRTESEDLLLAPIDPRLS